MVEERFLKQASNTHLGRMASDIQRFAEQSDDWGTRESALRFYQRALDRVAQSQSRGKAPPPPGGPPLASENMRFVLADPNGHVILPFFGFEAGQVMTRQELSEATPLYKDRVLQGYALARGKAALSPKDESYLATLQKTLLISASIAVFGAFLFGFAITCSIHKRVHSLIAATRHLSDRKKPQLLNMRGKDEVSLLAREFDAMSVKLTEQHQQLRESNQTIAAQANALKKLSYTDELTNLANRRFFNEQLAAWQASNMDELSLILCDVDHFKRVNDNFSHDIGDQVLRQVANLLKQNTREQDVVARIGGEELVILMPHTCKEQALDIADRIRHSVEQNEWHKIALGLKLTLSSGVSSTAELDDPERILEVADEHLYRAKDLGRNRVCS